MYLANSSCCCCNCLLIITIHISLQLFYRISNRVQVTPINHLEHWKVLTMAAAKMTTQPSRERFQDEKICVWIKTSTMHWLRDWEYDKENEIDRVKNRYKKPSKLSSLWWAVNSRRWNSLNENIVFDITIHGNRQSCSEWLELYAASNSNKQTHIHTHVDSVVVHCYYCCCCCCTVDELSFMKYSLFLTRTSFTRMPLVSCSRFQSSVLLLSFFAVNNGKKMKWILSVI